MDITDDDMGVNADDKVRIMRMVTVTTASRVDLPRHKYTEALGLDIEYWHKRPCTASCSLAGTNASTSGCPRCTAIWL